MFWKFGVMTFLLLVMVELYRSKTLLKIKVQKSKIKILKTSIIQ